ncbi:MAG: preprotein translocase subunit YajC [Alphaproteobacteria bacterium]|nr:preprotein translocase subunit YajC [Alphaproteobacteria bacterium]
MFINDAYAAAEPALIDGSAAGGTFLQLALILLIFYFLLIRPQQKRVKEHMAMVEALKVGDNVVTNSGLYGKISKIEDKIIALEIAAGVIVRIDRLAVSGVVETPAKAVAKETKSIEMKTKGKKK